MVGPQVARRWCLALLLGASLAAACGGTPTASLSDLGGVDELKTRFDADAGRPRMVLLLSPT